MRIADQPPAWVREAPYSRQADADLLAALGDLPHPIKSVAAPVVTGRAAGGPDGEIDSTSGGPQFFDQLGARLAGPNDEDASRGKFSRSSVAV